MGKGNEKMGRKKKSEINAENQRVIPAYFPKDNSLISSKSKMTLLGRKVFDVAIMHVEEGVGDNGMPEVHSIINGQELKEFMQRKSNSLYEQVKELIDDKPTTGEKSLKPSLLDWRIIIKDDEKQEIDAKNVITGASFKNGTLKIVFNNALKDNLIGYKKNYTLLDKEIICKFHKNYSYQLYQLFKKTIDRQRAITKKDGIFEMEIDLADLKVQLGIVEASENDILYKAVTNESVSTYDELSKIKDKKLVKKLKEYGNFRIYALEPAKEEINELSDIDMDFIPVPRGLGGDTVAVKFYIKYKDVVSNSSYTSLDEEREVDIFDFIDDIRGMMSDVSFSSKDLKSIAEAAGRDRNKVEKAYKVMMASKGDVDNATGFMIKAIREDYDMPPAKKGRKKKESWSSEMLSNKVDFEELENQLLDN